MTLHPGSGQPSSPICASLHWCPQAVHCKVALLARIPSVVLKGDWQTRGEGCGPMVVDLWVHFRRLGEFPQPIVLLCGAHALVSATKHPINRLSGCYTVASH